MGTHPFIDDTDLVTSTVQNIGGIDYLALLYDSIPIRNDVTLDAEHSTTLLSGSFTTMGVINEILSTTCNRDRIRSRIPITAGHHDFLRLRAE